MIKKMRMTILTKMNDAVDNTKIDCIVDYVNNYRKVMTMNFIEVLINYRNLKNA